MEITVLVQQTEVTGQEEAAPVEGGARLLGLAVVPDHDPRSPHTDLPHALDRQVLSIGATIRTSVPAIGRPTVNRVTSGGSEGPGRRHG